MRSEFRAFIMLPGSKFKDKLMLNEGFNIIHDFNSVEKMQRHIFYYTTINSYMDTCHGIISKLFQKIINNNIAKSYTTKFKLLLENSNAKLYSTYFIYKPISSTKLSKRYKSEIVSFHNKNNIKIFNMKSITKNNWEIK